MFKHIIPTQRFGQITIDCIDANVDHDFYMFNILFEDFSKVEIKLTLKTLEQILDSANKIKSLYKENKNEQ